MTPAMSQEKERAMLEPGSSGIAELTVTDADLASSLNLEPGDDFPPVLATARMIALMEVAGARLLVPLLKPGELSVGVTVDIVHTAATPQGVTVVAEARFTGIEGKLYAFDVVARDPGGEIGRGTHKRAIVAAERIVAGANKRCPASVQQSS